MAYTYFASSYETIVPECTMPPQVEAVERGVAAEGASVVLARRTVEVAGYWGCWRHP